MKKLAFFLILLFFQTAFSQKEYHQLNRPQGDLLGQRKKIAPVLIRAYPVAVDSSNYRVYLISETVYDFLQFTRQGDDFVARVQFEATLISEKSKDIYSAIWSDKILVERFKDTNRRDKFFLSLDSLLLPAGKYTLTFQYQDLQGKQRQKYRLKLRLKRPGAFYASPPLFCDLSPETVSPVSAFPYRPLAAREFVPFNTPIGILLNTWAPGEQTVRIHVKMLTHDRKQPLYVLDTLLQVTSSTAPACIKPPFLEWDEDDYQLRVVYYTASDSIKQKLPVHIIWFNKPHSLVSLEYALQALEPVLPKDQLREIKSGDSEQKKRKFRAYWKKQDPTPGTALNEVMLEFYTRVDSADFRWGNKGKWGWRTDPGRIYLLYGRPDRVEDESLDPVNPHMVWIYKYPKKRLVFTFEALNGRTRYRLIDQYEEPF